MSSSSSNNRKPFIGGNWKSNGTIKSVKELVNGLNEGKYPDFVEAVVAPTMLHLPYVYNSLKNNYSISAQNCSRTSNGAYTGEISADALVDFGLKWVILGHSERRAYYNDTNEIVGDKVAVAQKSGLNVIACLGETLEQRESNQTANVILRQLKAIADKVDDWSRIVIAYEPVWAIGTGKVATPEQAQEAHEILRNWLRENVNDNVANQTRIIYGGSVKPNNCDTLWSKPDVDGFLVGGASLKPNDFTRILNAPASKL